MVFIYQPNFENNGLYEVYNKDQGRMRLYEELLKTVKFSVPLKYEPTGPYMHDGRFKTLKKVINHYNEHVKPSPTVEFILQYNLKNPKV